MPAADRHRALQVLPKLKLTVLFLACALPTTSSYVSAQALRQTSLNTLSIVCSNEATPTEVTAIRLLTSESEKRTGENWPVVRVASNDKEIPQGDTLLIIGRDSQIHSLLPRQTSQQWQAIAPSAVFLHRAEGFSIRTIFSGKRVVLVIDGNDSRGILYGIGYLLRKMELSEGNAVLHAPINISLAPQYAVRSHQIGYRYKNNTYDGWTLSMFEQQIRDLAVFGISGLQLIAPHSDDRPTSPLYPAPALETIVGISRLLNKYGLDCDIYYPEMRKNYGSASDVAAELVDFESLMRELPRVNALYVPGGDPGNTDPKDLLALMAKESVILHRYHPGAKVWVSAQGFSQQRFQEFYDLLQQQKPAWLTGVFFGPQSRDSFATQRSHIPAMYKMLFYPDIAHTMHAQFPVPDWDPAYAMTEGREPIDPRPVDETKIYRHFAALHSGFVTYSEGVNDDTNKFLWSQLGWSQNASPQETMRDYSRYFFGPRIGRISSDAVADGIFALEKNWRGPLLQHANVMTTLKTFQAMETAADSQQKNNWRFESLLYRAYYDAYLYTRLQAETKQQAAAYHSLATANNIGSAAAMQAAQAELVPTTPMPGEDLRAHVFDLAGRLYDHVRLQLSVEKYSASGVERGANLDRIDMPLNDRVWLVQQFDAIRRMPDETQRLSALNTIVNWSEPVAGSYYDDLGNPQHEPHLVRGESYDRDPEMYHSAINGIADKTANDGWRQSWLTYAETLYEQPLELRYSGLNPQAHYRVRITYAGEDYTLPLQLVANDRFTIHGPRRRKSNPETVEFDVPRSETRSGTLDLKWHGPDGTGGSGRGRQVAEVWLIPEPMGESNLRAPQNIATPITK